MKYNGKGYTHNKSSLNKDIARYLAFRIQINEQAHKIKGSDYGHSP